MFVHGNEKHPASRHVSVLDKYHNNMRITRFMAHTAIFAGVLLIVFGMQSFEVPQVGATIGQGANEPAAVVPMDKLLYAGFDGVENSGRGLELSRIENIKGKSTAYETDATTEDVTSTAEPSLSSVENAQIELRVISAKVEDEPEYEIEWLDDTFMISHYTFALESDPLYADDEKVRAPGLDDGERYRQGFLFGGRGVLQQGSGLAENGRYITIDWDKSHHDPEDFTKNRWYFKYGIGRPVEPWETVATHHPDLPQGTQIVIETYLGQHQFIVGDAGLDLADDQIDVFVGDITIGEADQLGITWSRVGIVRPYGYAYWQEQKRLEAQAEQTANPEPEISENIAADQE